MFLNVYTETEAHNFYLIYNLVFGIVTQIRWGKKKSEYEF